MKWTLGHTVRPGEIGYLTYLHCIVYAREYGIIQCIYGGLAESFQSLKPKKGRIWLARAHGRIIGSVAIVGRSKLEAQLRWFFVHPQYRGRGIGKNLLTEALQFSKRRKYRSVFLWTIGTGPAPHLYIDVGFRKTEEKTRHLIWGKTVKEERYDLHP